MARITCAFLAATATGNDVDFYLCGGISPGNEYGWLLPTADRPGGDEFLHESLSMVDARRTATLSHMFALAEAVLSFNAGALPKGTTAAVLLVPSNRDPPPDVGKMLVRAAHLFVVIEHRYDRPMGPPSTLYGLVTINRKRQEWAFFEHADGGAHGQHKRALRDAAVRAVERLHEGQVRVPREVEDDSGAAELVMEGHCLADTYDPRMCGSLHVLAALRAVLRAEAGKPKSSGIGGPGVRNPGMETLAEICQSLKQ